MSSYSVPTDHNSKSELSDLDNAKARALQAKETVAKNRADTPDEWSSHTWAPGPTSKIMLCSSKIVHLRASGTSNSRYLAVHLELLCFLLPYFRAAFKGGFQEREKDSLDVEVSQHVLEIVVAWMYTGQLTGEHCLYARTLIDVYIFADKFEFLALRRSIIRPAAFRRYKGCRFCSSYSTVSHAYRNLPSNSPLLRFIEKTYIQHWRCDVDEDPIDHSDRAAAPPEFLSAVLYGRDKMLRDAQDKRSKGDENAMSDMQKCACCNDVCLFHEHQSEEERKASCGR